MVDLNAHEAGNGGQSQGKPTACGVLLYSENTSAFPLRGSTYPPMPPSTHHWMANRVAARA
jgi:hypothetical protein